MTRADTLARLAVCDAEAHAALRDLGVERPDSDAEVIARSVWAALYGGAS